MNDTNHDHLLRRAIKEYWRMAEGAKADAANCLDVEPVRGLGRLQIHGLCAFCVSLSVKCNPLAF